MTANKKAKKVSNTVFVNGVRILKMSPPPQKRTQKWNWKSIPVESAMEIQAKVWPAETKLNSKGTSNVAAAAYAWARKNGVVFRAQHLSNGNVYIYNLGQRGEV